MGKVEISVKVLQVRVYDKHPDNYKTAVAFYLDGDKAFTFGLKGDDVYKEFGIIFDELTLLYGVQELSGSITPIHARYLRMRLSKAYTLTFGPPKTVYGRTMVWVTISRP